MSVALVTGGQQGIGLAVAQGLHVAGFRVAVASLPEADDPGVVAAMAGMPGASYHRHDLRDVDGVPGLLDAVEAAQGPVTVLVQNAGIPAPVRGDMLDLTPADYDAVMAVNARGALFLAQGVARRMLAGAGARSILFVTSVSAQLASPERAGYCMSKAALAMGAQALALRLAPEGIGVFDLRPGIIATPMTAGVRDRYDARIADGLVPAGRWGQPGDVARAVVALARGDFAFSTGAVIPVDGGLSIGRL